MKKRTLMAIFAALTLGATMAATTSCDVLAQIPVIGGFFQPAPEEKEAHALKWDYDSIITITPVEGEIPTTMFEGDTFSFTITVPNGYEIEKVNGANKSDDGSYTVEMMKKDKTVKITVRKILNELVVEPVGNLAYFEGQTVKAEDLVVTAKYALGDEVVTDYEIAYTTGSAFTVGDTGFTVSFGGKSVEVELSTPVVATHAFYDAKLIVEEDKPILFMKGIYNATGTQEEAKATVEAWFNNCMERGSWATKEFTANVTMESNTAFTIKLSITGEMSSGRQYYFHYGTGADGQDLSSALDPTWIGVYGTVPNESYETVLLDGTAKEPVALDNTATVYFPEGEAAYIEKVRESGTTQYVLGAGESSYVETSDGTKWYLGYIPNWGPVPLIICPINEAAPEFTGIGLEAVEGKPYAVFSGTCKAGLTQEEAEAIVLNLTKHLDFEDIKNGNAKLVGDYIHEGAFVMYGGEDDGEGNMVGGAPRAYVTYDATAGTFKIYALLEGDQIVDGAAFFGHLGAQGSDGYYPNVGLTPDGSEITANGFVFKFVTAADLGLTETWQAGLTYISVTAVAAAE